MDPDVFMAQGTEYLATTVARVKPCRTFVEIITKTTNFSIQDMK